MSTSHIYTLSPVAFALPLLHAAAHPSSTVQGILLAPSNPAVTASTGSGRTPLEITEAIPLVHTLTSLTPIIEAGLEHVEVYSQTKGLRVVGMYEIGEGSGLSRAGKGLLGGLKKGTEGVFALTVNIAQLQRGGNPYIMTLSQDPSKPLPSSSAPLSMSNPSASAQTLRLIREDKAHTLVKDWDQHMDDSSVGWLDQAAVKEAIRKRLTT